MEIDKFKDRLAISFKECGLTPQQITDVIPRFPVETSILENISANSPYFNFKEKNFSLSLFKDNSPFLLPSSMTWI